MDPTPEERQRSPFVTFLYFLLGLAAVLLLVGGVGIYLFLRTEKGQKILTLAREGTAILAEAATAPGTSALRDIGCETALAVQAGKIMELFRQLEPASFGDELGGGFLAAGGLDPETPVVFCSQRKPGTPDCSAAAKVYASAVPQPPQRFVVLMAPREGDLAGCSGIFGPDGTRLADLPELPAGPGAKPAEEAPAEADPEASPSAAVP